MDVLLLGEKRTSNIRTLMSLHDPERKWRANFAGIAVILL
jgi:hypothetical protein